MGRSVSYPSFPDSAGKWLACYRYRRFLEGEAPASPEEFGRLLGVSGPTIRRWEAGRLRPAQRDIHLFAEACELGHVETEFLVNAFAAQEYEQPPEEHDFRLWASRILSLEYPAYLLDSLYYVRAWSSYMGALDGPTRIHARDAPILSVSRPDALADDDDRAWTWLRDFWFSTSELCGSIPYRSVLNDLAKSPKFRERWFEIALGHPRWLQEPLGLPYYFRNGNGLFHVFTTRIIFPPTYHLRIYIPADETARRCLELVSSSGPAYVSFHPDPHWGTSLLRTSSPHV